MKQKATMLANSLIVVLHYSAWQVGIA